MGSGLVNELAQGKTKILFVGTNTSCSPGHGHVVLFILSKGMDYKDKVNICLFSPFSVCCRVKVSVNHQIQGDIPRGQQSTVKFGNVEWLIIYNVYVRHDAIVQSSRRLK